MRKDKGEKLKELYIKIQKSKMVLKSQENPFKIKKIVNDPQFKDCTISNKVNEFNYQQEIEHIKTKLVHCYEYKDDMNFSQKNGKNGCKQNRNYVEKEQELLKIKQTDYQIVQNNKDADIYKNYAIVQESFNRFEEALQYYDYAIQKNPEDLNEYHNKCKIEFILKKRKCFKKVQIVLKKNYNNMIMKFKKILKIIMNIIIKVKLNSYQNQANAFKSLNRFEEAIQYNDYAINRKPDEANYYATKADTLQKMNRNDEALQYYDYAINRNPDDAYYYATKADTLEKMNRNEEALQYYDYAINRNPDHANYYATKAYTLQKMNRAEEALQYQDYAIQKIS